MAVLIHILDKTADKMVHLVTLVHQVIIIQDDQEVLVDMVVGIIDDSRDQVIQVRLTLGAAAQGFEGCFSE